ncbi:NADH-quinone oxidoreductase subunit C [Phosphitispora sp. TUW77]|uniref:hydrogenase large subunit n=1 Tax=Phosphitispora sp. TUW77 TaxID=3152361 RepID=UPI003AB892E2
MTAQGSHRFTQPEQFVTYLMEAFGGRMISKPSVSYPGEVHFQTEKSNIICIAAKLNNNLGFSLIQLTATDERTINGSFMLYYTFACYLDKFIVVIRTSVGEDDPVFPSITKDVPAAHWYEREIKDLFGLKPEGHPDNRRLVLHKDWPQNLFPMRRDFKPDSEVPRHEGHFSFDKVEGEGVIQIPVGPIHAGIIEPGHFRFSAVGENVINLEARFFYTHRGMEKLCEGTTPNHGLLIAERICGACSLSHSTAFCQAVEKLANTKVPDRANFIRTIGLELERLYNHIGDVGNICAGTGFAFGTMHGARLKEEIMRLNERVFGSRFLRGINIPGGVRRDIRENDCEAILSTLRDVEKDFRELTDILLSTESYLDRCEGTGILQQQTALDLHAVGPAARAAGINRDTRRDHPYVAYDRVFFGVPVYKEGDVLARFKIRIDETFESMGIIRQALELMPAGEIWESLGEMAPFCYAVGITESARGENVHFVMSGEDGTIFRHMVRSASYCNWPVVPSTVPGNIVPDFPLINKSFELCYSCLDR